MKIRIFTGIIVTAIIGCGVFGILKRKSYTDITSDPNYLDQIYVAELSAEFAVESCERMAEILPGAPNILRVSFTDNLEHLFGISRQKAKVEEVYAGNKIKAGDELYLTADCWSMIVREDFASIQRGFVNIPQQEEQYLVFLGEEIETLDDSLFVYGLYQESLITPMFCYADISNIVIPTAGDTTYVPYSQVRNNEFFAESEQGLDAWYNLKNKMISSYPIN